MSLFPHWNRFGVNVHQSFIFGTIPLILSCYSLFGCHYTAETVTILLLPIGVFFEYGLGQPLTNGSHLMS